MSLFSQARLPETEDGFGLDDALKLIKELRLENQKIYIYIYIYLYIYKYLDERIEFRKIIRQCLFKILKIHSHPFFLFFFFFFFFIFFF